MPGGATPPHAGEAGTNERGGIAWQGGWKEIGGQVGSESQGMWDRTVIASGGKVISEASVQGGRDVALAVSAGVGRSAWQETATHEGQSDMPARNRGGGSRARARWLLLLLRARRRRRALGHRAELADQKVAQAGHQDGGVGRDALLKLLCQLRAGEVGAATERRRVSRTWRAGQKSSLHALPPSVPHPPPPCKPPISRATPRPRRADGGRAARSGPCAPLQSSTLTSGFSPILPPRKILTPSTAFPSSLAGAPISPMSPTWACTEREGGQGSRRTRVAGLSNMRKSCDRACTRARRGAEAGRLAGRPPSLPKMRQSWRRRSTPAHTSWGSRSRGCARWRGCRAAPPAHEPPAKQWDRLSVKGFTGRDPGPSTGRKDGGGRGWLRLTLTRCLHTQACVMKLDPPTSRARFLVSMRARGQNCEPVQDTRPRSRGPGRGQAGRGAGRGAEKGSSPPQSAC